MRLGAPIFEKNLSPEAWVKALKGLGYTAAYCPVGHEASDDVVKDFEKAARAADVIIAEVGAWSNPMGPDETKRKEAVSFCRNRLALADRIGARCCVNIAGSRGEQWDGHDPRNLTDETFDLIVEMVRGIIDDVKPKRSFYALETMQWMYPDSADSYLDLIKAIDRKQFAVHFDPTNLVYSPQRFYKTGDLIRDFCRKLGPRIKSCHAKDIALSPKATVHLDEVRPGLGGLDYATYLTEVNKLDPDLPLMIEHLQTPEQYSAAADHIRKVARENKVKIR